MERRRELRNFFKKEKDSGGIEWVRDNKGLVIVGMISALVVNALVCTPGGGSTGSGNVVAPVVDPVGRKIDASPERKPESWKASKE